MGGILGSGLAFPLRVDARGGLALAHEDEDVREAISVILGTAPGERPMRPEFGCGIHDYVFEAVDAYLVGRVEQEVRRALDRWEPRIDVVSVDMSVEPGPGGGMVDELVVIEITYRLRATNDVRNLVHPFYVIPAEESTP
jgi:phage baseplate assembly protein W